MEIVDTTLSSIFSDKYASTAITLFLVLYGGLAAPKLPGFIVKLFDNPIFKILILALIVYNGNRDPAFAIMIAVTFTITLNTISKQKFMEGFADDDIDPIPDCGKNYYYDEDKNICVEIGTFSNVSEDFSSDLEENTENSELDSTVEGFTDDNPEDCKENEEYDEFSKMCLPAPEPKSVVGYSNGLESFGNLGDDECPEGEGRDPDTGECVPESLLD